MNWYEMFDKACLMFSIEDGNQQHYILDEIELSQTEATPHKP
jgi:hypothetical protein